MKYDVIMWDVDGTIIDSEHLYNKAIRHASLQCGVNIEQISDEQLCGLHMQAVWELIQKKYVIDADYAHWLALLEQFYIEHRDELVPVDNSSELIRYFHEQGIEQVCVSNSSRKIIEINLDVLNIHHEIKFIVSVDDVKHGKPDPEPYLKALKSFENKKVIAVEDSLTGVKAANAADLSVAKYQATSIPFHGYTITDLNQLKQIVL